MRRLPKADLTWYGLINKLIAHALFPHPHLCRTGPGRSRIIGHHPFLQPIQLPGVIPPPIRHHPDGLPERPQLSQRILVHQHQIRPIANGNGPERHRPRHILRNHASGRPCRRRQHLIRRQPGANERLQVVMQRHARHEPRNGRRIRPRDERHVGVGHRFREAREERHAAVQRAGALLVAVVAPRNAVAGRYVARCRRLQKARHDVRAAPLPGNRRIRVQVGRHVGAGLADGLDHAGNFLHERRAVVLSCGRLREHGVHEFFRVRDEQLAGGHLLFEPHARHAMPGDRHVLAPRFVHDGVEAGGRQVRVELDEFVAVRLRQPHGRARLLRRRDEEIAVAGAAVQAERRVDARARHASLVDRRPHLRDEFVRRIAHVEDGRDAVREEDRHVAPRVRMRVHVRQPGREVQRAVAVDPVRARRHVDVRPHVRDLAVDDERGLVRQHALRVHGHDVDVDERGHRGRGRLGGRRRDGGQDGERNDNTAKCGMQDATSMAMLDAAELSRSAPRKLLKLIHMRAGVPPDDTPLIVEYEPIEPDRRRDERGLARPRRILDVERDVAVRIEPDQPRVRARIHARVVDHVSALPSLVSAGADVRPQIAAVLVRPHFGCRPRRVVDRVFRDGAEARIAPGRRARRLVLARGAVVEHQQVAVRRNRQRMLPDRRRAAGHRQRQGAQRRIAHVPVLGGVAQQPADAPALVVELDDEVLAARHEQRVVRRHVDRGVHVEPVDPVAHEAGRVVAARHHGRAEDGRHVPLFAHMAVRIDLGQHRAGMRHAAGQRVQLGQEARLAGDEVVVEIGDVGRVQVDAAGCAVQLDPVQGRRAAAAHQEALAVERRRD